MAIADGFIQDKHGAKKGAERFKAGDRMILYASKTVFGGKEPYQKFIGLGTATGDVYEHVRDDGDVHWRQKVDWQAAAEDAPVKPLLEPLTFIKDVKRWGFPFMRGTFKIDEADAALIARAMGLAL